MKTFPQAAFGQVTPLPFFVSSSVWEIASPPLTILANYKLIVLMNFNDIFEFCIYNKNLQLMLMKQKLEVKVTEKGEEQITAVCDSKLIMRSRFVQVEVKHASIFVAGWRRRRSSGARTTSEIKLCLFSSLWQKEGYRLL